MATIEDIGNLGYTIGIASGSVQVEQDALQSASDAAAPAVILSQASQVTQNTLSAIDQAGKLPSDPGDRKTLAEAIAADAIDQLSTRADERVDFHQRAVAVAQDMPNVWHLSGYGLEGYIACKEDGTGWDDDAQAHLDALANPDAHAERVYQFENPDAMYAAVEFRRLGYDVARPELGADVFTVDGEKLAGADIVARVAAAEPKPSAVDNVLAALEADPGLSDATKKLITAALSR